MRPNSNQQILLDVVENLKGRTDLTKSQINVVKNTMCCMKMRDTRMSHKLIENMYEKSNV